MSTLPQADVMHVQSVIICLLASSWRVTCQNITYKAGVGGDVFPPSSSLSDIGELFGRTLDLLSWSRFRPSRPKARHALAIGPTWPYNALFPQLLMHIARPMNPGTHPWVYLTSHSPQCKPYLVPDYLGREPRLPFLKCPPATSKLLSVVPAPQRYKIQLVSFVSGYSDTHRSGLVQHLPGLYRVPAVRYTQLPSSSTI
jgi:hypothetical protein